MRKTGHDTDTAHSYSRILSHSLALPVVSRPCLLALLLEVVRGPRLLPCLLHRRIARARRGSSSRLRRWSSGGSGLWRTGSEPSTHLIESRHHGGGDDRLLRWRRLRLSRKLRHHREIRQLRKRRARRQGWRRRWWCCRESGGAWRLRQW